MTCFNKKYTFPINDFHTSVFKALSVGKPFVLTEMSGIITVYCKMDAELFRLKILKAIIPNI